MKNRVYLSYRLCDSFDPVTDPDHAHVKVKNMQIVNGCQTATTLALAEKNGVLTKDTRVMLRIYETNDLQLVDSIVLTTNNQNKISSRDLRSNDKIQIDMEQAFAGYNLFYERKVNQFSSDIATDRIVVNEIVAQSYLGIILKKPSDARRRKYKVWGEMYDKIFSGQIVEPYIVSVLLFRTVTNWLSKSKLTIDPDDLNRKLSKNGAFHIARIAAFLWRGTDNWNLSSDEFIEHIQILENNPDSLNQIFDNAFNKLKTIISINIHYLADLDAALKSGTLDSDIDKALHTIK